jgi:hypothetical protein
MKAKIWGLASRLWLRDFVRSARIGGVELWLSKVEREDRAKKQQECLTIACPTGGWLY